MPLEIKELTIKVTINEHNHHKKYNDDEMMFSDKKQQEIIKICVDKVLEKLENKRKR
jgi:hypothetical protein